MFNSFFWAGKVSPLKRRADGGAPGEDAGRGLARLYGTVMPFPTGEVTGALMHQNLRNLTVRKGNTVL